MCFINNVWKVTEIFNTLYKSFMKILVELLNTTATLISELLTINRTYFGETEFCE